MQSLEDFVDDEFFQFEKNDSNVFDEASTSTAMEVSYSCNKEHDFDVTSLLKHRIEVIGKTSENLKLQLNEKQKFHFEFIENLKKTNQIICETSLHLKYPLNVVSHWLRVISNQQLILGFKVFNSTFKSVSDLNIILDTSDPIIYETKFFKENGLEITTEIDKLIIESKQTIYILIHCVEMPNFERANKINFNVNLCYSFENGRTLQMPLPSIEFLAINILKGDYRIHFESENFLLEDLLNVLAVCIKSTLNIEFESNSNQMKFIKYLKKLQFKNIFQESYWLHQQTLTSLPNTANQIIIIQCPILLEEKKVCCNLTKFKINIFTLFEEDQFVLMHYLKDNIPEKFTCSTFESA